MFNIGDRVVCVKDDFQPWVYDLYKQLPKKGKVYTVRDCSLARVNPQFVIDKDANIKLTRTEPSLGILLEELVNPPDPYASGTQELTFSPERFREVEPAAEDEEELVLLQPHQSYASF